MSLAVLCFYLDPFSTTWWIRIHIIKIRKKLLLNDKKNSDLIQSFLHLLSYYYFWIVFKKRIKKFNRFFSLKLIMYPSETARIRIQIGVNFWIGSKYIVTYYYTVRKVLADLAVFAWWRYWKLSQTKEGNGRTFRHTELSNSVSS